MTDEITLEDKSYVSSKRASELSGYSQDYIGQLARGGYIDAQRVGGLWYIHLDSLKSYKEKTENEKPQPPQPNTSQDPDTLVFFDGKEFISASRGSEVSGYSQDYVGQLARSGKILARQVGTRWYVDRKALIQHKKEKDALLAAVQAASVGIQARESSVERSSRVDANKSFELHFTYAPENKDLIPAIAEDSLESINATENSLEDETHPIPIHIVRKDPSHAEASRVPLHTLQSSRALAYRRRITSSRVLGGVAVALVLVIGGFISLKGASYTSGTEGRTVLVASVYRSLDGFTAYLERLLVPEIIYTRNR